MLELRSVDPRTLVFNPDDPRRTPAAAGMDEQLLASVKAVGIIQPPRVKQVGDTLVIIAGKRRTSAAIAADLDRIDVLVGDADEAGDPMRSVSENLIRASMTSVDIWRATEALEAQGWNEQAIADALALPIRTVRKLKLLANLHPPMLDIMARGDMPSENHLRTIAAATREEQAQVWKKHKPKKGQEVPWWLIANGLSKRRLPASLAKFTDEHAAAYGVVWDDDLFAPAGEDGRTTTNCEGFFGAQQAWLQDNLPAGGTLLPVNEYGTPQLPKKAEQSYGKPGKGDLIGHYVHPQTGEVKTVAYRMPEPKQAAKAGTSSEAGENTSAVAAPAAKPRADVTQKGMAMIGDFRTDALHQALQESEIDDLTLIGLLVIAFAGKNVSVQSGTMYGEREAVSRTISEAGLLTADPDELRTAAKAMLRLVLSCRENMTNSGPVGRIAGEAIGASRLLPHMATEEFLSCLSKNAVEKAAVELGVTVGVRAKDTRAALIERGKTGHYTYPAALFQLTEHELGKGLADSRYTFVRGTAAANANDDDADDAGDRDADTGDDGPDPAMAIAAE